MAEETIDELDKAVAELRSGINTVEDDFAGPTLRLGMNVLAEAADAAHDNLTPARVNDIEFALSDIVGMADSLSMEESSKVMDPLNRLQALVSELKQLTALSEDVLKGIRALKTKLVARRSAIERQTYRPAGTAEPLPHPPEEMQDDARALQRQLSAAGFATPVLDALIHDPGSFRFHSIGELIDELEVVSGE